MIGLDTNALARYFVVETDADAATESQRQAALRRWMGPRQSGWQRPIGTRQPSPGPLTAQASSQGKADQGRLRARQTKAGLPWRRLAPRSSLSWLRDQL